MIFDFNKIKPKKKVEQDFWETFITRPVPISPMKFWQKVSRASSKKIKLHQSAIVYILMCLLDRVQSYSKTIIEKIIQYFDIELFNRDAISQVFEEIGKDEEGE